MTVIDTSGTELEIPRDRWDRPLTIPPGGGKRVPYTRVSTLAKTLADQSALTGWKGRMVAAGLAVDPDLWWDAKAVLDKYGLDPQFRDGKTAWGDLAERAAAAAGAGKWAEIGTLVHGLVEDAIRTGSREFDGPWGPHVAEFFRVVEERYEIVGTEVFVVNDVVRAAGTLDLLLRDRATGRVLVGDLKTGGHDPSYPIPVTTQVAVYAGGLRYDPVSGERAPLDATDGVDAGEGVLVHLPAKVSPPVCDLYPLDLSLGRSLADWSVEVRELRKMRKLKPYPALKAGSDVGTEQGA